VADPFFQWMAQHSPSKVWAIMPMPVSLSPTWIFQEKTLQEPDLANLVSIQGHGVQMGLHNALKRPPCRVGKMNIRSTFQ
jgi:hypothetical protein